MLEYIDLTQTVDKTEYKPAMTAFERKLGALQRDVQHHKVPIVFIFEGWDAAGKGTIINRITLSLDPRGFKVYHVKPPNEEERLRPFLWRFWRKIPERGGIAIFDRSWVGRLIEERVEKNIKSKVLVRAYDEINSIERQLSNDGYLILKFFLHISQKEQKKRFKAFMENPATQWRVAERDWDHHAKYEKYIKYYEEMLAKTDTEVAPWTIVGAHDRRFTTLQTFKTAIEKIEQKIEAVSQKKKTKPVKKKSTQSLPKLQESILDRVDLSLSLSRDQYEADLKKYQERIRELEHEVYKKRIPVVILYEGWDASGKGGNIKRLVQRMDPRGYEVIPIGAPTEDELRHHYLWRFRKHFPKAGHFVLFDRSWYGRVLVERVEGYCTEEEWKRAYSEINEMEEHWANFGAVIVKFWIHISKEEQLARFKSREELDYKSWKITEEDWRNREKWESYKEAVDEMLFRTSTRYAPWTVIEGNSKLYARIKAIKTVIQAVESKL
ncbi:MAG: phosphate--AMP phosphotransferase [Candidatus Aminicenantes bacterium]|jgi:polyphosphate:AMP phosphotransferase